MLYFFQLFFVLNALLATRYFTFVISLVLGSTKISPVAEKK